MRWRIAQPRAIGLLIVLGFNAGLLANVIAELTFDDFTAVDKIDWNVNLSRSSTTAANRRPLESYEQILARPILFKSREPFVPAPPALLAVASAPPPAVVDPGFAVGGVMMKSGLSKVYLLSKTGSGAWATEGEVVQGWKVKSIDGAGVKLEQAGRTIDLRLYPSQ